MAKREFHSNADDKIATYKEDRPEYGKVYALTGGTDDKSIANGNSWAESEVKENNPLTYELMIITSKKAGEQEARELGTRARIGIIVMGGEIKESDFWGKRKFAYEIGNENEGFYEVIEFEAEVGLIDGLKDRLNLEPNLVRYLVSRID